MTTRPIHLAPNILDLKYKGEFIGGLDLIQGNKMIHDRTDYLYEVGTDGARDVMTDLAHYRNSQSSA